MAGNLGEEGGHAGAVMLVDVDLAADLLGAAAVTEAHDHRRLMLDGHSAAARRQSEAEGDEAAASHPARRGS